MAKPTESDLAVLSQWVNAKFAACLFEKPLRCPMLKVVRQDFVHNPCMVRRSLVNSPLTIGDRTFARGIATHVESVIEVTLPAGGTKLTAQIGRDQNQTVFESRGNIQFVVEVGGKEIFRITINARRRGTAPHPGAIAWCQ